MQVSGNNILELMKESRIYWQARKQIISIMQKKAQSNETMADVLMSSPYLDKINGLISNCLQKNTRRVPLQRDINPQIEVYRLKWSQLLSKEFNSIAGKILREEQCGEQDQSVSYIYDCSSLLEFLSSIRTKHNTLIRDSPSLMFPQQVLKVSKYSSLRNKYSFLLSNENIQFEGDWKQREKRGKRISDGQSLSSQIEAYLSQGCALGERKHVYQRYFDCFYQYLGKRVDYKTYEKVWRHIIRTDSKEAVHDSQYFVFQEEIYKVYQIFICDKQLGHMLRLKQLSPTQTRLDKYAPIHSTLPCKSFARYISPFCYFYNAPDDIYEIFREVYANYFILLNTVSSLPDTILPLCILFEELLYTTEKRILAKFQELGVPALKVVFPWIFYCFIGYVDVEQFFLLLDRIISTRSLQILPLYCVSLLYKEKDDILQAKDVAHIQQILESSLDEDVMAETVKEFLKYHL